MTRAELSALVVGWLDDTKQGYFTPTIVNLWLNLAQRQVQFELIGAGQNYYVKPYETLTVSGQGDYVFPANMIDIDRIEIVVSGTGPDEDKRPIEIVTLNQQDSVPKQLGCPDTCYIKKDRFTLLPTPDKQYVIRLYAELKVQDLIADTDVPDVPEHFMEYVAIVAAFNGYIKDDRTPENLVAKKAEYREILRKIADQRKRNHSRKVVDVHDDNWIGFY